MPGERRRKTTHSCQQCRLRKVRCDRQRPCLRCVASGTVDQCRYSGSDDGAPSAVENIVFLAEPSLDRSMPRCPATQQNPPGSLNDAPTQARPTSAAPRPSPKLELGWNGSLAADTSIEPGTGRSISTPKEILRGENSGPTVYWGRTHGAVTMYQFPEAIKFLLASNETEIPTFYRVPVATRMEPPSDPLILEQLQDSGLRSLIPTRYLGDKLLKIYQENFELCYRVVHFPSFVKSYLHFWEQPQLATSHFLASLLCICAISSGFVTEDTSIDVARVQDRALRWTEAVQAWVLKQDEKSRPNLSYMQVHCLLLIANEMNRVPNENVWISAGALVRIAMAAGLHREPSDFPKISPFWAEMRRRIWYTILELELQMSLEQGWMHLLSPDDFDTAPPANINDERLKENMEHAPISQSSRTITHSSGQILLAKSWELRSRACRISNKIKFDTTYEAVLQVDTELMNLLGEARQITAGDKSSFRKFLLNDMIYKAILAVHRVFAGRAAHDPRLLYSCQVNLESAVDILSQALSTWNEKENGEVVILFEHLANICRGTLTKSIQILCYELLEQTKYHQKSAGHLKPTAVRQWRQPQQDVLIDLIERSIAALNTVSGSDETIHNISSWLQMTMSFSKAVVKGRDPIKAMEEALRSSVQTDLLAMRRAEILHSRPSGSLLNGESDIGPSTDLGQWLSNDENFQMLFSMDGMQTMADCLLENDLLPLK